MDEEYNLLTSLGTWQLEELPQDRSLLDCKWTYRLKRDGDGKITRYKARLVAKGFSQIPGIDFFETYAPVVRLDTFRLLMAIAAQRNLIIHGMDVVGAYLNGKLDESIYMAQPPEYSDGSGKAAHLKLTLYGLKQSGRVWNEKLNATFLGLGYTRLMSDQCVYIRQMDSGPIIVAVHVDDMTLLAPDDETISNMKEELKKKLNVTDMGEIQYILGMKIDRNWDKGTITLSQKAYILKVLERMGMNDCKPVKMPMDPNVRLEKIPAGDSRSVDTATRQYYHTGVGSLMYAANGSRPDIAHAVTELSKYVQNPAAEHVTALKRVFRYLKDSDWGEDRADRRSTSGYVCTYAGGAVTWSSKKQPTVALSTMEAEYMALAHTAREVIWLRALLTELGLPPDGATTIFVDNQSAIKFAENPIFHARSKHIDIRHHFVRERMASNEVKVQHCASEENLGDIFTKGLPRPLHEYLSAGILGTRN